MNKTNIHNNKNKNKLFVASIAIVVTLALIACPMVSVDNDAFAIKKKYNDGGNVAEQSISPSQSSIQNALCASGETTLLSAITLASKIKKNGNNVLAQQGDDNDKGGNSAKQSISQSQSSQQNNHAVLGRGTVGPGNNINVLNQENSRSNAAAQS